MTVYEKLNDARLSFQKKNVKKSGQNKFAGYSYYELSDILPAINEIAKELKFSCVVTFGTGIAQLEFIDAEKPQDRITFLRPMSKASLKGCHEVQNLGAVETYIKRYLYQNCFEIVENDALDLTMNPNENGNQTQGQNQNGNQTQGQNQRTYQNNSSGGHNRFNCGYNR